MRAVEPVSVIELFAGERGALVHLLSGLSAAQWQSPTICAGWTVKDVAVHLLGDDVGLLSRERDGFADPESVHVSVTNVDDLVGLLNGSNDLWVRAARRISPRLLAELLDWSGQATLAYFNSVDLHAPGERVSWAGPGPAPGWLGVAREYTERWLHQQQIRDAVGPPGLKEPRWFAPVLATFMRALPHTLRDVLAPPGTVLRVIVAGAAGGMWDAVRLADGWMLAHAVSGQPTATARLDQESAWRLFTKGSTKEEVRGTVALSGDLALANKALDMVAIIG